MGPLSNKPFAHILGLLYLFFIVMKDLQRLDSQLLIVLICQESELTLFPLLQVLIYSKKFKFLRGEYEWKQLSEWLGTNRKKY